MKESGHDHPYNFKNGCHERNVKQTYIQEDTSLGPPPQSPNTQKDILYPCDSTLTAGSGEAA